MYDAQKRIKENNEKKSKKEIDDERTKEWKKK